MNESQLPQRCHPAHHPPHIRVNHPTILFLTLCVKDKRPLLANTEAQHLLLDGWTKADRWLVGRYVIMPDHIHLFCAPRDLNCRLKAWITYWKNEVTRQWPRKNEKPIWQREFWDTQLRREESYGNKWEYVRQNPVRAGLVESPDDWPFCGEINVLRW